MWRLFPVFDNSDRKRITRAANHIVRESQVARGWAGFPEDAIAIAEHGGGDLLIIRDGYDDVESWDQDTGESETAEADWR